MKTQGALPTDDAAVSLLFSLVASGQITLHKLDGWRRLAAVIRQPGDLSVFPTRLIGRVGPLPQDQPPESEARLSNFAWAECRHIEQLRGPTGAAVQVAQRQDPLWRASVRAAPPRAAPPRRGT